MLFIGLGLGGQFIWPIPLKTEDLNTIYESIKEPHNLSLGYSVMS